jgi:hypothetical protein
MASLSTARSRSALCFDADPDLAKQNAPRSNAPASPARQMCSDPNLKLLRAFLVMNLGSLVSMASIRQKARMFFSASFITTDKHHVHQQGAIVRSSRELSSKAA